MSYDESDDDGCTMYIGVSNSSILIHPYFIYPSVKNPGIEEFYEKESPENTEYNLYEKLYTDLCKENGSVPVKNIIPSFNTNVVNLKYYKLNAIDIKSICGALLENEIVEAIDFSENFLQLRSCHYIGQLLLINKKIKHINLSNCRIGSDGIKCLIKGLQLNKSLEEINLSHNYIQDEGMEMLSSIIIDNNIKKYNLSHNDLKSISINFANDTIRELDLSWNTIETPCIQQFLKNLKQNISLLSLDISWNGLSGDTIGISLRNFLRTNSHLQYLDISNNRLTGKAVEILSQAFSKIKSLKILKLGNNPIKPINALRVMMNFKNKSNILEDLNMDNICVTPEFVNMLKIMKNNNPTKNINVTYGNIIGNYKIIGPKAKELLFNRAKYLLWHKKRNKKDFGICILKLQDVFKKNPTKQEFIDYLKTKKIKLDNTLLNEICNEFRGKMKTKVDIKAMINYVLELWPETKFSAEVKKPAKKQTKKTKTKKPKNKD